MGRELQKKKNRSSTPRVRLKPKSKKRILSNPVIAANWDKKQTLAQNYRRLGLRAKLNTATGGVEKNAATVAKEDVPVEETAPPKDSLALPAALPRNAVLIPTEVRIERDPKTGAILRVLDGSEAEASAPAPPSSHRKPLQDQLSTVLQDEDDSETEQTLTAHAPRGLVPKPRTSNSATTEVVATLERMAADEQGQRGKARRTQSAREQAWAQTLFEKHGRNWMAMVRDKTLNVRQQTEGDIKRRVGLWLEARGEEA